MRFRRVFGFAGCVLLGICASAQTPSSQRQDADSHSRKAEEFLKQNRADLAARELKAAVNLNPANLDAQNNLGVILFFHGDFAEAAPHLRAVVNAKPQLSRTRTLLGMCEKRVGEIAAAEVDLSESWKDLTDEKLKVQAAMELLELYSGSGNIEKSVAVVSLLRQLRPADPEILFTAYRIYSTLVDEATLSLGMSAPGSAQMHQLMAHELSRQGNTVAAIAHYREALKIDPQLPGAHFELAEMLAAVPDPEAAQKEYVAAIAANPFDEKSECRLGEMALRASEPKTASDHFLRALRLRPDDADANVGMAKIYIGMNQQAKAQPLLERAVALEPFDSVIHYHLSMVYRGLGRAADSRRELGEFQRLKAMKEKLRLTYHDMRLEPKPERITPTDPK